MEAPEKLPDPIRAMLLESDHLPFGLAAISPWEVAKKASKRLLHLSMPVRQWVAHATQAPFIELLPLFGGYRPRIGAFACTLPQRPSRPNDRRHSADAQSGPDQCRSTAARLSTRANKVEITNQIYSANFCLRAPQLSTSIAVAGIDISVRRAIWVAVVGGRTPLAKVCLLSTTTGDGPNPTGVPTIGVYLGGHFTQRRELSVARESNDAGASLVDAQTLKGARR